MSAVCGCEGGVADHRGSAITYGLVSRGTFSAVAIGAPQRDSR
ncbi:hypothetical protein MTO96_044460, partial [Rhipicephalus appendiculatus]